MSSKVNMEKIYVALDKALFLHLMFVFRSVNNRVVYYFSLSYVSGFIMCNIAWIWYSSSSNVSFGQNFSSCAFYKVFSISTYVTLTIAYNYSVWCNYYGTGDPRFMQYMRSRPMAAVLRSFRTSPIPHIKNLQYILWALPITWQMHVARRRLQSEIGQHIVTPDKVRGNL